MRAHCFNLGNQCRFYHTERQTSKDPRTLHQCRDPHIKYGKPRTDSNEKLPVFIAEKLEDMSSIRVPDSFPEKEKLRAYVSKIQIIKAYVSARFSCHQHGMQKKTTLAQ